MFEWLTNPIGLKEVTVYKISRYRIGEGDEECIWVDFEPSNDELVNICFGLGWGYDRSEVAESIEIRELLLSQGKDERVLCGKD